MQNPKEVQLSAEALRSRFPASFRAAPESVCVIAGTGLSGMIDALGQSVAEIPFAAIPGFPQAGVASHPGRFSARSVDGLPILVQMGRCHLYEGRAPAQVCMGARVMIGLGFRTLIITNAAGGLNPYFTPGSIMLIRDIINFTGVSPLEGENHDAWGERFPDMSAPFDSDLCALANRLAPRIGLRLENGVYIGVRGPQMETPAETRAFRSLGADAVGMSSVLEIIAARHMGAKVLGFSSITNVNLPDCMAPAPLETVIAMAQKSGAALGNLIAALCRALAKGESI